MNLSTRFKALMKSKQKCGLALLLLLMVFCLLPPTAVIALSDEAVLPGITQDQGAAPAEETANVDAVVLLPADAVIPQSILEPASEPPIQILTDTTISDVNNSVTVSGLLPQGAYLIVTPIAAGDVASYVQSGAEILFAYDIKIMVPCETGDVEYQPGADVPVTVTVATPPINESGIEVLHVNESTNAAETVAAVITTASTGVTFQAESFSIYVGTTAKVELTTYPANLYYNGSGFFSDEACSGESTQIVDNTGTPITRLPALVAAVDTGGTTIYMKAAYDVTNAESIDGGTKQVVLMRHSSNTGNLITVSSAGDLTLANITIDGGAVWGGASNAKLQRGTTNSGITAAASLVKSTGSLTVNDGAFIQNNEWQGKDGSHNGGGINATGMLTINGGAVRNCFAGHYGAGIQVVGTFNMTGGEIYGTQCGTSGSAVMLGGTLNTGTVFTLTGGRIHHNSSSNCGGVCVAFGTTFIMNGGEISHNYATNGGGIYLHGSSTATINAGKISYNSADRGGGCGIESDGGTLTMNGGEMTYNTATSCAGGIYSKRDETAAYHILVLVNGGTILNNTVNGISQDIYNYCAEANNVKIDGGVVGSVTLNKNDSTVLPKNSDDETVVNQVVQVPNVSGITAVTDISITDSDGNAYPYGANTQTDVYGNLSVWVPEGCTVNGVTTFANGEYTVHDLNQTAAHAVINYTSPAAGQTLTASLIGGTAESYMWYRNGIVIGGETRNTYVTQAADINKQIYVVISDGTYDYTSAAATVIANSPTFTINIPPSVDMNTSENFSISGTLGDFCVSQGINITVTPGSANFKLQNSGEALTYTLYTDAQKTAKVSAGGTVASYTTNGENSTSLYYSIDEQPKAAGAYTDTLTFTISLQ